METVRFTIKQSFAQHNKIPSRFIGIILRETDRAIYVYGHGTIETANTGYCCVCGATLTHPVSIKLGIGPICGGHYWDWNLVGGFSEDNVERLLKEIGTLYRNMKVDTWMPRSVVQEMVPTEEKVEVPSDHKMFGKREEKASVPTATLARSAKSGDFIIKIVFPFNRELLEKIRTLEGRRYNPDEKYWIAPLCVENAEALRSWGFYIDPKIQKYLEKARINIDELDDSGLEIPGLGMKLFPYQKKGVAFIEAKGGRALIADEMGLGKTAEALAWLHLHPENRPAIIVVPASLKLNWLREIQLWMRGPGLTEILNGTTPYEIEGDIVIINYDILAYWVDALCSMVPSVIIADEVHFVKNNSAKRTKAMKKLAKYAKHFIALSGTPIVNRPVEFLNAIMMIDRTLFPNSWHYLNKYCGARHNGFGWDFTGATKTEELHDILIKSIMIRRLKKDVLKELPDKTRSFVPMELTNMDIYSLAEVNFIRFVAIQKGPEAAARASAAQALAEIEGLKQLAVKGKMDQAVEWIRNFLDNDQKLVVMAVHKFVIDRLMEEFAGIAVKVDGSVSGQNRQSAVDLFQEDPSIRLFIGNIKAAGVGLTLTASSSVAFLELPWTPGDLTQAEDRVHRIGQKDAVNIYYLLAQDTIEEKIAKLLDKKRKVLDAVLDGAVPEEGSLLAELMEEYKTTK